MKEPWLPKVYVGGEESEDGLYVAGVNVPGTSNGIKMKFKGTGACKASLSLLTKLCGSCFA